MIFSPIDILKEFRASFEADTYSWVHLISERFHFRGPIHRAEGKTEFVEMQKRTAPMIKENLLLRALVCGDFVVTQAVTTVEMPTGKQITLDMTEWYEIKRGKIHSLKVYYDPSEQLKELAQLV